MGSKLYWMNIKAVTTRVLQPPKDDLLSVLDESLPKLTEKSVVVISSKVVAIWQGRCVPMSGDSARHSLEKEALVKEESAWYLPRDASHTFTRIFTIYEGVLCSSAGIDESNGDGHFILLPKDCDGAAEQIRAHLKRRDALEDIGVIISDSRSTPLRNGATAVAFGHAGF